MKLVINIPESMYEGVMMDRVLDTTVIRILNEIKNGTVLPKGHGKLIDVDELLTSERPKGIADDVWEESHIYKLLTNAQAIIKADIESDDYYRGAQEEY